jgi:hypothetical protein
MVRRERLRARHVNPSSPTGLLHSIEALAFFGEKRVGTAAGARAGAYLHDRLRGAGLEVSYEEFLFPRHDVEQATLEVQIGERWQEPGFDVFEGSGSGDLDAPIVYAGTATEQEVAARAGALAGKIALVERNRFYHRSSQYLNLRRAGALAMIDVSAAPGNLRQVGSVRRGFEATTDLPALTLGADDGDELVAAIRAGIAVRGRLRVAAGSTPASGANVVGRIRGREGGRGQIVIGAHYDTWFTGSTDNGAGVAALLALAELWAAREAPRFDLTFVAWDGEEIALYGGYDFLRRHRVLVDEPIVAVLNLETPAAAGGMFLGLARSGCPCLDHALRAGELDRVYTGYLPMSLVPKIFGGVIPTDVQGWHRAGIATASTAVDAPYYHTSADTPDKVDLDLLVRTVHGFDRAIAALMAQEPRPGAVVDPELWRAEVALAPDRTGEPLVARVTVRDAEGAPQPGIPVEAVLLHDDFFLGAEVSGRTDGRGVVELEVSAAMARRGDGGRYLHVGAGPVYPLCETIVSLPVAPPALGR